MPPIAILILLTAVQAGTGLLMVGLGYPMFREKVAPNSMYGFRTPKTLANEAIWYAANREAGRHMIRCGWLMVVSSPVFWIPNLTNPVVLVIAGIAYIGPLTLMFVLSLRSLGRIVREHEASSADAD